MAPAKPSGRRNRLWAVLALAAIVGAVYANSLTGEFVYDDLIFIKRNELIRSLSNLPAFFAQSFWDSSAQHGGLYFRPLVLTSYALNFALGGYNTVGYHVLNVLLHVGNTLWVAGLVYLLSGRASLAGVTGLLFGLHPAHTEAVAWVSGRTDLLAAFWALGVLTFYVWAHPPAEMGNVRKPAPGGYMVAALAFYALGLLSKESVVTLPAVLILYEWLFRRGQRGAIARILPFFLVLGAYLFWRTWVLAGISPSIIFVKNPLAQSNYYVRLLSGVVLFGKYVLLLLAPVKLSFDYGFEQIPTVVSASDPRFLGAMLVASALLLVAVYAGRRDRLIGFGLGFFVIVGGIIFANALMPFGVMYAERFMYLPSIGLLLACMAAAAYGLERISPGASRERIGTVVVAIVALLFAGRTFVRNGDWRDAYTMALRTQATSQHSATAQSNMGQQHFERGDMTAAAQCFQQARGIFPRYGRAYLGLGDIALARGEPRAALEHLLEADELEPNAEGTLLSLGVAYKRLGMLEQARSTYQKALRLNPKNSRTYNNLANIFLMEGDLPSAFEYWHRAVEIDPFNAEAVYNLAFQYERAGDLNKARTFYRRFVEVAPPRLAEVKARIMQKLEEL